ncbi:MAG: PD-(D/E)XK nuclease family protein [bacterium]|nr:PD-(D/E)XK nuclease family protein [bacterium]
MRQVSFSQLMTYVRCPEHWLFRYKFGLKRSPKKVFKHGFALHETLAYHFDQKKKDGKGIPVAEAKEFFVGAFQNALEDYVIELEAARPFLTREYLSKEKGMKVEDLVESGLKGIEVYYKKLNQYIKPDLVEEAFEFPAGKGIKVVGRIDMTDKQGVIHELKTTRKSPNKQDIRVDPQLAIYQLGYHSITGKYPKAISKDYIVLSKKDSKIVRFQVARPFVDRATILRNVNAIMEAANRNIFYCLHPAESWLCSKEWCGYYTLHQELKKLGLQKFMAKYTKK